MPPQLAGVVQLLSAPPPVQVRDEGAVSLTVMVNVCAALVSTPPLAVPPLSWMCTVTVVLPSTLAAGVYVRVPVSEIAGWTLNRPLSSLVTMKSTTCADSLAGPALIEVAQPAIVCRPEFSLTAWLAPLTNEGTSLTGFTVIVTVALADGTIWSLAR